MIPNCEIIVHEILLQQKKDLLVVAPIMTDAGDLIGCLFGQLKSRTFVLFLRWKSKRIGFSCHEAIAILG
jgi:hypothetical protein